MRIISKYKDYYDSVQSMGIDQSIVYERFKKETKFLKPPNFDKFINKLYLESFGEIICDGSREPDVSTTLYSSQVFLIGFCGKLYLAYNFEYYQKGKSKISKTFYAAHSVLEFIQQIKIKHKQRELVYFINYYGGQGPSKHEIEQTFDQSLLKQEYNDWFHHFKAPVFMIVVDGDSQNSIKEAKLRNEECAVIINPKLKDLDFFRLKDAFSCYQSIEQYITGVLANTERAGSNMTSKEKIQSHGFDMKYGFRTRPKDR